MLMWEKIFNRISETAGKCPQDSYAAVVRAIKSEWFFLQRATWYTGDAFAGVEKMIQETCLPRLFFGNTKILSTIVGTLSTIPIKVAGIGLLNPVTSAKEKYLSSHLGSADLFRAVVGGRGILQYLSHMDARERKTWHKERPGSHE